MSPARCSRWTAAAASAGSLAFAMLRCGPAAARAGGRRGRSAATAPRSCMPGGRVHHLRRQLGQRPEHVGALEQVRPRQLQARLLADQVAVQQHVQVHGARRPARRVARPAAQRLDGVQPLRAPRASGSCGAEAGDQVDEVSPLEADRAVAVPGREARAGKFASQLRPPRAPGCSRARRCCRRRRRRRGTCSARAGQPRPAKIGARALDDARRRRASCGWRRAC